MSKGLDSVALSDVPAEAGAGYEAASKVIACPVDKGTLSDGECSGVRPPTEVEENASSGGEEVQNANAQERSAHVQSQ